MRISVGVQTCALPIFVGHAFPIIPEPPRRRAGQLGDGRALGIVEGRAIVGRHAHAARRLGDRDAAVREVAVLEQPAQRLPRRAPALLHAAPLPRRAQGRIVREPIRNVAVPARPLTRLTAPPRPPPARPQHLPHPPPPPVPPTPP